jgi:hypothetical protein
MASMVFSRAALVLVGLGVATVEGYGLAGRTTLARSALLAAAPARVGPAAALQMNIFEKAVSGAASAIGSQLGRVAGMPEMSEAEQKAMEKAMLDGTLNFDQFLIQLRVITKAGSIAAIAAKIPGAGDKIDPRAAAMVRAPRGLAEGGRAQPVVVGTEGWVMHREGSRTPTRAGCRRARGRMRPRLLMRRAGSAARLTARASGRARVRVAA